MHLFVYGTLRPGIAHPMARWLTGFAEESAEARMRGRLFELGGYPGMRPAAGEDEWVMGEVLRLREAESIWPYLDEYEGAEFERVRGEALTASNEAVACWVYMCRKEPAQHLRIPGGDYLCQTRWGTPRSRSARRS